jgi:sensor histidine kinase YesM
MESPFAQKSFFLAFAASCVLCGSVVAYVVHSFGFSNKIAVQDAALSVVLWLLGAILIANTLRYYLPQQSRFIFLGGLIVTLTAIFIGVSSVIILKWLVRSYAYREFYMQSIPVRVAFSFLVFTSYGLVFAFWFTMHNQQLNEKRSTEALQLAKEAELNSLQEKLQPHFLFNSLNSINALVVVQPERARLMVQQLSDFLRGTLKRESNAYIPLEQELEYLTLYLEIEKVRFGHRLQTSVEIKGNAGQCMLPPFILLPVLENAIKFGLYDTLHDIHITLNARCEGSLLEVAVSNPFDSETAGQYKGTGFGLKSVKRRLHLLFDRSDLLITKTTENIFTTTVLIPQIT